MQSSEIKPPCSSRMGTGIPCAFVFCRIGQVAGFADRQQARRRPGDDDADLADHAEGQHRRHDIAQPRRAERAHSSR